MRLRPEIKRTGSTGSFIRFNNDINLYELVGTEHVTQTEVGAGRVEYIEKQVVIKTGPKEACIELDKQMFPEKYF